jgi:hypothetical protein
MEDELDRYAASSGTEHKKHRCKAPFPDRQRAKYVPVYVHQLDCRTHSGGQLTPMQAYHTAERLR